jgi:hypothetical protein
VCSLTSSEDGQDHFWIQKYILLFTAGEIKTKVDRLKSVCKCGWRGMVGGGGFGGYLRQCINAIIFSRALFLGLFF